MVNEQNDSYTPLVFLVALMQPQKERPSDNQFLSQWPTGTYVHTYMSGEQPQLVWLFVTVGRDHAVGSGIHVQKRGNDLETVGRGRLWAFHGLFSFYGLDNKHEAIRHRNKDERTEVKLRLRSMICCVFNVGCILHTYYS